jgi:hypothetical protein
MKESIGRRINVAFNISDERARELIDRTLPKWRSYVTGGMPFGDFVATAMNYDDLLTNEKCFLICHCTVKAQEESFRRLIRDGEYEELLKALYF